MLGALTTGLPEELRHSLTGSRGGQVDSLLPCLFPCHKAHCQRGYALNARNRVRRQGITERWCLHAKRKWVDKRKRRTVDGANGGQGYTGQLEAGVV